jgi:hypothetical protein
MTVKTVLFLLFTDDRTANTFVPPSVLGEPHAGTAPALNAWKALVQLSHP